MTCEVLYKFPCGVSSGPIDTLVVAKMDVGGGVEVVVAWQTEDANEWNDFLLRAENSIVLTPEEESEARKLAKEISKSL
jgi:hypothetical protein